MGPPGKMQQCQPAGFGEAEGGESPVELGAPQSGDQPELKAEIFLILERQIHLVADRYPLL
jgi:hypothetical protein